MKQMRLAYGFSVGPAFVALTALSTPIWDFPAISRVKFEKVDPEK